jgi:hypothetical protein
MWGHIKNLIPYECFQRFFRPFKINVWELKIHIY